MAWNQSTGPTKVEPKKPSALKGVVAGVVCVAIAAAVAFFVMSGKDAKPKVKVERSLRSDMITPVPPTVRTNVVRQQEKVEVDKSKMSSVWQRYYDGRDTNKWKVVVNPKTKKEYLSRIVRTGLKNAKPPIYNNRALNILDAIVFKPIVSPMANVRIDDRYMKSFQEALINKIDINAEDTDEVKARKQGMIELLADLKKQLKEGADIKKIMQDALDERNRIATLKRTLEREQAKMRAEGASEEDIETYVELCNKKLEEKGATPIMSRRRAFELIEEQNLKRAEGNKK